MTIDLRRRVRLTQGYTEASSRPVIVGYVTARCNLACTHCYFYRDGHPNERVSPRLEMPDDEMLAILAALRDRHGARLMVWLGGEPMLRRSLLERGVDLFDYNIVATNGTLPLFDLGIRASYHFSLDGPPDVNDAIRGEGTFARVFANLAGLPDDFVSAVQIRCTVTRAIEGRLGEFLDHVIETRADFVTFSFYVPSRDDTSGLGWATLEDRMAAVDEVRRLKLAYPDFVSNDLAALDLMAPEQAPAVVADCPYRATALPLFVEGDHFTTAFCSYGNDADCSRCGAWVAYEFAARPFTLEPAPS